MQNGQQHGIHYHPQASHTAYFPPTGLNIYSPHGFQESSASPLAPALLPNYGSFGQFLPLGAQSLVDQQRFELQARPTDLETYRDTSNHIGTSVGVIHQNHASVLPVQAQFPLITIESDDEEAWFEDSDDEHLSSLALVAPVVQRLYTPGPRDTSMHSFSEFASSNAVSEYMSSPGLSELKDQAKREIFEHFMRVTGPSMSLYERHPFDSSEQEVADSVPASGTTIWSCKLSRTHL